MEIFILHIPFVSQPVSRQGISGGSESLERHFRFPKQDPPAAGALGTGSQTSAARLGSSAAATSSRGEIPPCTPRDCYSPSVVQGACRLPPLLVQNTRKQTVHTTNFTCYCRELACVISFINFLKSALKQFTVLPGVCCLDDHSNLFSPPNLSLLMITECSVWSLNHVLQPEIGRL